MRFPDRSRIEAMAVPAVAWGFAVIAAAAALLPWLPGPATAPPPPASAAALSPAGGPEPLAGAEVLSERPLFHPSRRPLAEPVPAPLAGPARATLRVVGIVGEEGTLTALLHLDPPDRLYRVRAGGRLGDWQVVDIRETAVDVVDPDGGSATLTLQRQP